MTKQIMTDKREQFLEECFSKGLAIADGLTEVWKIFGNESCKLLIDKEALQSFAEPVGWSGKSWGNAALRFFDWFNGSRENITATQLITLAYFGSISEEKSFKLYDQWIKEGANWDLAIVRERCEELAERKKRGSAIKIKAQVKFQKGEGEIVATPSEKFAWDRSNGDYIIALKKVKE